MRWSELDNEKMEPLMSFVERRFPEERRSGQERRSGKDRREEKNRQVKGRRMEESDRRDGDRRKTCMSCGNNYKPSSLGSTTCDCRTAALRSPGIF